MPKVTVYVPADLYQRMQERADLNWSALFQDIVQAELAKPQRDYIFLGATPKAAKRLKKVVSPGVA